MRVNRLRETVVFGWKLCFLWWQYILIVLIIVFFVPFVFVLFWGCFKLYNGHLSVARFLLACCFPLPFLVYWVFLFLFQLQRTAAQTATATRQMSKRYVETTLFGCFKKPADGGSLSLGWESVMIGRRLILILLKTFVNDPMPRLLIMSFLCVLWWYFCEVVETIILCAVPAIMSIFIIGAVLSLVIRFLFACFMWCYSKFKQSEDMRPLLSWTK